MKKLTREKILETVRHHGPAPVAFRDLMHLFGIDKGRRFTLKEAVDDLVREGVLAKMRGNRYALPDDADVVIGRLAVHRSGYGFVSPEKGGDDVFIPARYLRDNLHGDRVEVRVTGSRREGKREGRVLRTVERGLKRVVGRYESDGRIGRIIPDDRRITRDIPVSLAHTSTAKPGQVVVAELLEDAGGLRGRIVEVLGRPDEPEVEILTIIRKYDLPDGFSDETVKAARDVPREVPAESLAGRVDLRDRLTVTIDGETARDFDDAVSVKSEGGGRIRLWVSIADVSHYVTEGSPLDGEAFGRGTSVYFPDRVIPMLPEELSNGICSLNPGVDRLTVTAELLFDKGGQVVEAAFYPSVIRSAARLTYTEVRKVLADRDEDVLAARAALVPDLSLMGELAHLLTEKRLRRGSIDFDLPEPEIILDLQGETVSIGRAERNVAHRLIEEFMLAANEAVARFIEERRIPSLYRIHEHPDLVKLRDFQEFAAGFGYEFRLEEDKVAPGEFQRLLDEAAGKPEERLINEVLLRCMKQARYSAENTGHFGLAAPSYTHFTSPIRRYPDLVVHRVLKRILAGKIPAPLIEQLEGRMPEIAEQSSRRERVAMEAEREILQLKKVQFMLDKVGEEFDGFITGVTPSGFFVELIDLFVEGMVPLASLPPDFYRFQEKEHLLMGEGSRKMYRLGDRIRVKVGNVSIARREIDFVLPGASVSTLSDREDYPRLPVRGKPLPGSRKKPSSGRPGGPPKGRKGEGGRRDKQGGSGGRRRRH